MHVSSKVGFTTFDPEGNEFCVLEPKSRRA
jgi:hypothetical protein